MQQHDQSLRAIARLFENLTAQEMQNDKRTWENNRIESDHAALKKLTADTPLLVCLKTTAGQCMRDFQSLSSAKATLRGIETIRIIKHGMFVAGNRKPKVKSASFRSFSG